MLRYHEILEDDLTEDLCSPHEAPRSSKTSLMKQWKPASLMHSKSYRRAEAFSITRRALAQARAAGSTLCGSVCAMEDGCALLEDMTSPTEDMSPSNTPSRPEG